MNSNKISLKKGDLEICVEGDTKFVEKHFSVLKKEFLGHAREEGGHASQEEVSSLLNFYNEKKPSTHYDKIAVFAYYLMEQEKKSFKNDDIKNCYLELRKITKMPGNLQVTLSDTVRNTGYVKNVKRDQYELTATGINYVNHQLPPRAE